jgi:ABC-type glycerol-3-phosphate transport system permease component
MIRRIPHYVVLVILSAIVLVPFAYLLCSSLKGANDFFSSLFLPAGDGFLGIAWDRLTLDNFGRALRQPNFARAIVNSFFYSSVTAVLATLTCAMGGYALACFKFRGRQLTNSVVMASLVFPTILLLAPAYQLLFRLGLLDTIAGFILPATAPAFGIYLFREAMRGGVPMELIEAARIDGCGEIRIFFAVVLPLVRPMVGAFILITFLATWNNYISPQVVLQSPERFPLSVALAQLKGVYSHDAGLLMAATVISVVPVLALFLLLQREFIAGLTAGAVKR